MPTTLLSVILVFCVILLCIIIWGRMKYLQIHQLLDKESKEIEHINHIKSAILKNVQAYVLLIDNDFKVLETNYYQLTGTREGIEKKRVGDLLQCNNALSAKEGCGTNSYCNSCPVRHAIQQAFNQKKSFTNLEASLNVVTSENTSVECNTVISGAYLILDEQETMVITVHDITSQKQTERELTKAKKKAEEADLLKSMFLANMSHEIRTPLNAIMGFSEILYTATNDEEKVQYQEIIKSNAELLLQLVNDILDMSKIEAGTLEFNFNTVDINLLISELQLLFEMRVTDTGKNINVLANPSLLSCHIRTDRNRVAQILSNFMTNAIKFTENGNINIGYIAKESELYFYVTDTGIGIPQEELSRIFNRFIKLNKDKKGTGLGLSISKAIVTRLEGEIGANSTEGEGSTFWFTIPYSSCGKL